MRPLKKSLGKAGGQGGEVKVAVRNEKGRIVRWEEVALGEGLGAAEERVEEKAPGIERELVVVRVGPNPRIVVCEYFEVLERRTCRVLVGRHAAKFVRGMRFRMREPVNEAEYLAPWRYEGKIPRLKGRW